MALYSKTLQNYILQVFTLLNFFPGCCLNSELMEVIDYDIQVTIVIRSQDWRPGNPDSIPGRVRNYCFHRRVQAIYGVNSHYLFKGECRFIPLVARGWGVKLSTNSSLTLSLKTRVAKSPFSHTSWACTY
jgi:hypothetical protein